MNIAVSAPAGFKARHQRGGIERRVQEQVRHVQLLDDGGMGDRRTVAIVEEKVGAATLASGFGFIFAAEAPGQVSGPGRSKGIAEARAA